MMQSALTDSSFGVVTTTNIPYPIVDDVTKNVPKEANELLMGEPEQHVQHPSSSLEEGLRLGTQLDSRVISDKNSDQGTSRFNWENPHPQAEDIGNEIDLKLSDTSSIDTHSAGPFRVTLSIGGMTCSSCSSTITKMLSELQGVSEVSVVLLSNSATVIVDQKTVVEAVVEAIEDCGFVAEVTNIVPVNAPSLDSMNGVRTLTLRVKGMFCQQCPNTVMTAVKSLGADVKIVKPIAYPDCILEISYQPFPPTFTIRTIIAAIAHSKSPPFDVNIHSPPSFEERSRSIQARERRVLLRRLALAIVVAIPTFIIGIVFMTLVKNNNPTKAFLMQPIWIGNTSRFQWALLFLATPIQFYSANMFHRNAIKEIRALWRRKSTTPLFRRFIRFGSMNLLVSTGVSVAYFSSIALIGLAAAQPTSPTGFGDTTTYFDSVVLLTMFLLAGRYLEAYSKEHTADAITALGSLRPTQALLLSPVAYLSETMTTNSDVRDLEKGDLNQDEAVEFASPSFKLEKIDVNLLEVGDIVRIPSGTSPPADATITSGYETAFDESSLTGESKLVKKSHGDKVFTGTINKMRMVDARVSAHGGATMLDHIVRVVREGQTRRAPIERVADFITGYFVPVVTLLAIMTWVIWLSLGLSGALPSYYLDISIGGWPVWSLQFAIAVFVIACPCGIGLAAPTALLVGSGLAAKHGILARGGGEAFQEMSQVDIIVFDKTGTLTEGGEPTVSDAQLFLTNTLLERQVILGIAANLESSSSHPLGSAIRRYCESEGAVSVDGSMFEESAGRGLKAYFETLHCTAIIGNEAWLDQHGAIVDGGVFQHLQTWKAEAKSIALLAIRIEDSDSKSSVFYVAAIFAVADRLRPEAKAVLSRLQQEGIGTWMISGDNVETAKAVARTVGIPSANVIAGVLPHEKAQRIQWLQQVGAKRNLSSWRTIFRKRQLNQRCIVAMVGDGINDAPALTVADIGVAIGSGSDVAISSASFILLSSNLKSLLTLSDLSRRVFGRVKQNFFYAGIYNCIALPIAAGVIYPAHHVRLSPVWASLAMALSSVSVICSSLLLKLYKEPKMLAE